MKAQPSVPPELDLLDEREAARVLNVAVSTLQKRRVLGGGPPFVKLGRLVRYMRADLREHVRQNVRSSTGDKGAA